MNTEKRSRAEEIKYQAEHYDEVPLFSSYKGISAIVLGIIYLFGVFSLVYAHEYLLAIITLVVSGVLIYFLVKGSKWSILLLLGFTVYGVVDQVLELMIHERVYAAWLPLFFGFIICRLLLSSYQVEKKKSALSIEVTNNKKNLSSSPCSSSRQNPIIIALLVVGISCIAALTIVAFQRIEDKASHNEWLCLQRINYASGGNYYQYAEENRLKNFKTHPSGGY